MGMNLNGALAVAYSPELKKNVLVKLGPANHADYNGVIQNFFTGSPEQETVDLDKSCIRTVIVNVDPEKVETVLGVRIEPYISRERLKNVGDVVYFRDVSPAELKKIQNSLINVRKAYKTKGLSFLFPSKVVVKKNSGKMQGYCSLKKGDESFTIGLCPAIFSGEGLDSVEHILAHEYSHPLWEYYLNEEQKAKWLSLYTSYSEIKEITSNDLESALNDLKGAGSVKDYLSSCEPEEKRIFQLIMKWVKQTYRIDSKSISLLLGQDKDISKYWPSTPLHLSDMLDTVSQYAAKSPVEFFCEANAKYIMGKELPAKIEKRCKFTIKSLQPK